MVFPLLFILAAIRVFPKFAGTAYNLIWAPFVQEDIDTPGTGLNRIYGKGSIGEPVLNLLRAEAFTSVEDFAAVTAGLIVRGGGIRAGSGFLGSITAAGATAGLVKSAGGLAAAMGALLGVIQDPAKTTAVAQGFLREVIDQQSAGRNLLREVTEAGTTLAKAIRDPGSVSIGVLSHELQTAMGGVADFIRRALEGVPPQGKPARESTAAEKASDQVLLRKARERARKGQEKLEEEEPPPSKPPIGIPNPQSVPVLAPAGPVQLGFRTFTRSIVGGFKFFSKSLDSADGKALAGLIARRLG